jgi:hypothetical protein
VAAADPDRVVIGFVISFMNSLGWIYELTKPGTPIHDATGVTLGDRKLTEEEKAAKEAAEEAAKAAEKQAEAGGAPAPAPGEVATRYGETSSSDALATKPTGPSPASLIQACIHSGRPKTARPASSSSGASSRCRSAGRRRACRGRARAGRP